MGAPLRTLLRGVEKKGEPPFSSGLDSASAQASAAESRRRDNRLTRHLARPETGAIAAWETVRRGAVRGAADNFLRLKWTQSDTFSVEDTINRMEAAVAEKPDMLVITATDPQAMRPTLEKAAADGIPVIAINVEDPAPKDERVPYLLYIGADMYLSGQEAAARVLSVRPDAKRAVCFHNAPGHVGLDAMCRGFLDGMKDGSGAPGEVVPVSFDISVSEATVSNYFTANPDTDALFTMDAGPAAFGALLEVVRRENRTDDVTLVTFDVSPLLLEAVESGETVAGIDQLMYMQGYLPAVLTRAYLDWGMIPFERHHNRPRRYRSEQHRGGKETRHGGRFALTSDFDAAHREFGFGLPVRSPFLRVREYGRTGDPGPRRVAQERDRP